MGEALSNVTHTYALNRDRRGDAMDSGKAGGDGVQIRVISQPPYPLLVHEHLPQVLEVHVDGVKTFFDVEVNEQRSRGRVRRQEVHRMSLLVDELGHHLDHPRKSVEFEHLAVERELDLIIGVPAPLRTCQHAW